MPIFHDEIDPLDHEAFLAWIAAHPDGYYLNERSEREVMLHRGRCHHIEFNVPVRLIAARKVCSLDPQRLRAWATAHQRRFLECSDCLTEGYRVRAV